MITLVEQVELFLEEQDMLLEQKSFREIVKMVASLAKKVGVEIPLKIIAKTWKKWKSIFGKYNQVDAEVIRKLDQEYKKMVEALRIAGKVYKADDPRYIALKKEAEAVKKQLDDLKKNAKKELTPARALFGVIVSMYVVTAVAFAVAGPEKVLLKMMENTTDTNSDVDLMLETVSLLEAEGNEKASILKKVLEGIKKYGLDVPKGKVLEVLKKYFTYASDMTPEKIKDLEAKLNETFKEIYNLEKSGATDPETQKKLKNLRKEYAKVQKAIDTYTLKKGQVNWKNIIIAAIVILVIATLVIWYIKSRKQKQQPQPAGV